MENKSMFNLIPRKFGSVETTLEGPLTASNDKQYYKAKFEENVADADGYCGQSRTYTKCLFEDSHSLLFMKARDAQENNKTLKILAGRMIIPTAKPFYILDSNGERMKKSNGEYRKGKSITLFLIADENPETAYNQAINSLTAKNAWVEDEEPEEEIEAEEIKASTKSKK